MKQYYIFAQVNTNQIETHLVTTADYYEAEGIVDSIINKYGNVVYVIYPADKVTYYEALRNFADYLEQYDAQ